MNRFRRILAILTDSPADRSALRWARQVADRAHTERIDINSVLAVKAKGEGLPLLRALLGGGADAPAEFASAR